ncbi:MAG: 2-C-methyl-D-erythritol 2,4-cyclodiphosphate synthase [Rikenellaceae bacterium]|nr:2-C-methyl-D-erythritol 2,4-cyclodiphosphate synthase [Rikenellaceae bacterium]
MDFDMEVIRIGHGYDVHALRDGLPLILGGESIEHDKGFVAHSDGDVLAHALSDALLGALALGDIGSHFPDTDPQYCGADSLDLLSKVYGMIRQKGYRLANADMTILLQRPKLRPHIDRMRENIARTLWVDIDRISIKATTEERLGFTGREEGAAAHAVVLLVKG